MNKKTRLIAPACAALAVLYIILAAKPLSREIQFIPVWTIETDNASLPSSEENVSFENAVPFKLGQNLGYVSPEGKIISRVTFPYKASVCRDFYTVYGTASEEIDFFSPDGTKQGTIAGTGFPYFTDGKKYLFLPGGASFTMLNEDGSQKWLYEGSTPLTAFSASDTGTVAGFADGTVIAFNDSGEITQQYKPGGSTWEIVYGAAISRNSRYIATLSGQDSQRFVISEQHPEKLDSNASITFYKTMKEELNRQVLIKFSRNEKRVYYSCASGIGVVDLEKMRDSMIPLKGRVLSIQESSDGKEVFILSRDDSKYTVSVIEGFNVLAGKFSFEGDSAFIAAEGNSLFIGRDSKISKINIERK